MEQLPKRTSLVAQTLAILREAIMTGQWLEKLPGEQELCQRFQVSRITIRAALHQLQREGWVTAGQGRRRSVTQQVANRQTAPADRRVVLLSPLALQSLPAATLLWVDALRANLTAVGYQLEFLASASCYAARPLHALTTLMQKRQPAAWVLYLSTAALQQWFSDRNLPCVISGSMHSGVHLASVDIDYAATCQHAVGRFAAKGHRRVALLLPRSEQSGDMESRRGFSAAGAQSPSCETLVVSHDGTVPSICRTLTQLVQGLRSVTGILVAKPAHVVTAVTHLLRNNIKIPEALSLISRDDDPLLEYLVPSIARYHVDAQLFARKISRLVVDLIQGGVTRRQEVRLLPAFFPGETLSAAPLLQQKTS
ncbi:MAG: DNA-binding transcriptional regulator FrlR [Verrucomicrobia bacterium ADurb.Bin118]|jgi:DNA-binding LacI/PurR family transcriptional regulator|nr:MAG: DNA-binding transcriptional regulator FrlR [Verrucomicrobia bacterium ADurb.Bin118]